MAMVKKVFEMEELCCANCARKMEEAIAKVAGVGSCMITFMTQKMIVEYLEDEEKRIQKDIQKIVRKIEPDASVIFD